jgi:hypothetical protein
MYIIIIVIIVIIIKINIYIYISTCGFITWTQRLPPGLGCLDGRRVAVLRGPGMVSTRPGIRGRSKWMLDNYRVLIWGYIFV